MAVLTISGDPASRWEEVAHAAAQLLSFELVTESRLASIDGRGVRRRRKSPRQPGNQRPFRFSPAWRPNITYVIALTGAESLFNALPMLLRAGIVAPESRRAGNVMVDQRLERPSALKALAELDTEAKRLRKSRVGRTVKTALDLVLNMEFMDATQAVEVSARCPVAHGILLNHGLLSGAAEAQMQFHSRLLLAQHGIVPAGQANLKRVAFGHPSERPANPLNFYRIEW